MKAFIVGMFLILPFVFGARETFAQCDCFGADKDINGTRYSTAYEELKNADAVFYGQIVAMKMIARKPVRDGSNNYEVEITFKVEKAWRRDLDELVTIREYSDGCSIGFSIAARWLVYANFDQDKILRTDYCTRTRVTYRNVEKDFNEFEKNHVKQTKIVKASTH